MFGHKPNLVVPIRDRRQGVRILTLKNFWRALVVAVVGFGLVDLGLHLRHSSSDDYGRLVQKEIGHPAVVARRAPAVVVAEPVPDQQSADPFLVGPAAREQYLGTPAPLQPVTASATNVAAVDSGAIELQRADKAEAGVTPRGAGKHVSIVGDQSGVSIATTAKRDVPKLSGGIFR